MQLKSLEDTLKMTLEENAGGPVLFALIYALGEAAVQHVYDMGDMDLDELLAHYCMIQEHWS